jgi:hypothetical protein
MKAIRLYDWGDKERRRPLREVRVAATTDLTRNGVKRVYVWTEGLDENNLMLYPDKGTAYPEFDERLQKQRNSKIFLYEEVA